MKINPVIAAVSLALSAAAGAQTIPGSPGLPAAPSASDAIWTPPQCAGLSGTARETCLQQQTVRTPGRSEDAASRAGGGTPGSSADAAARTGVAPGSGVTTGVPGSALGTSPLGGTGTLGGTSPLGASTPGTTSGSTTGSTTSGSTIGGSSVPSAIGSAIGGTSTITK